VFLYSSCALFGFEDAPVQQITTTDFQKAQALVLNRQFEKALPFLESVLKKADDDYSSALLFSARSYDQLAQPEKVILALQELLARNIDSITEVKTRSLLLKNLAKVKTDISEHIQKKILFGRLKDLSLSVPETTSPDYVVGDVKSR
jgi:tetratricopeptide (TPR) repeat protein